MRILFSTLIVLSAISCKKEKLKNDKEILIGKWNWVQSIHKYGWCDGDSFEETLTPETLGADYSVTFEEKGFVEFFENSSSIGRYRIVFEWFNVVELDSFTLGIHLNNEKENIMTGFGSSDQFRFSRIPFKAEQGCEGYINSFVKE